MDQKTEHELAADLTMQAIAKHNLFAFFLEDCECGERLYCTLRIDNDDVGLYYQHITIVGDIDSADDEVILGKLGDPDILDRLPALIKKLRADLFCEYHDR